MSKTFAHLYTDPGVDMLNVPLAFERVPSAGEYIFVWLSDIRRENFRDESSSGATVFQVEHVELVASDNDTPPEYTSELFARHVPGQEYLGRRREILRYRD